MFFVSVRTRSNFSPARNVLSTTEPAASDFSFVRTNAPPLPGFTCWNSTMRHTWPSSWMCIPFLNWLVETVSAIRRASVLKAPQLYDRTCGPTRGAGPRHTEERRCSSLPEPSCGSRPSARSSSSAPLGVALADENPQPVDFTHNAVDAPAPVAGAVFGTGPAYKTGQAICTTPTQVTPNVNTDCAPTAGPHNETSIAVNPTDTDNMIGGANDYQLGLNPGGHVSETVLSRAHVTFDGGHTWSEYPINSNSAYQATGDPAVAFDASGHAYYATLGFRFVGPVNATNPDVIVANSGDGGKTWSSVRVASGSGNAGSVGDLLDKEYIAAWGDGNAIVTFGDFRLGQKGSFQNARIYSSVTHDSGRSWSRPRVISGSLDQAFVSVPAVAADGRIFVAFMNTDDLATGRDDYYVVEVSPATGAALGAPVDVATVIDGFTDYPIAFGRQTYQDSVFRTWAAGNITADPTNADHLAVVWSDMRNSPLPAPADPYAAVTNSDVVVSQSFDGGSTWSAPVALTLSGDQFMPWGAYDQAGLLRIGTFDRSYDAANHRYGYTLATEAAPGSLAFATAPVTTVAVRPDDGRPLVRADARPGVPERDRVPRRLLEHRRDAGRERRRLLLDGHAQPGVLRRRLPLRRGRVLREDAVGEELRRGVRPAAPELTPPRAAPCRASSAPRPRPRGRRRGPRSGRRRGRPGRSRARS